MSEQDQSSKESKDPVAALEYLATSAEQPVARPDEGEGQADPSTALSKMNAGQEADVERLLSGEQAGSTTPDGTLAPADELDENTPLTDVSAARPAQPMASARFSARQAKTNAHLYRKTMIPLLLTVGGLLVLIGLLSAGMVAAGWAEDKTVALALVTGVSFPLAGILFFGAWWFRRDVRRSGG